MSEQSYPDELMASAESRRHNRRHVSDNIAPIDVTPLDMEAEYLTIVLEQDALHRILYRFGHVIAVLARYIAELGEPEFEA